jgi:hypothetical protein
MIHALLVFPFPLDLHIICCMLYITFDLACMPIPYTMETETAIFQSGAEHLTAHDAEFIRVYQSLRCSALATLCTLLCVPTPACSHQEDQD